MYRLLYYITVISVLVISYLPGLMAEIGRIRCPINFPFSSHTASLSEARVGRTTWTCVVTWVIRRGWEVKEKPIVLSPRYLVENKRLVIPHRVQGISVGGFGFEFPLCVSWKSKHVHLNVHAHFFFSQELPWHHLLMNILNISCYYDSSCSFYPLQNSLA